MSDPSTNMLRTFLQRTECVVDPQGRINFPKPWRLPTDNESTEFVLTPGHTRSINVFPRERFNLLLEKINNAPMDEQTQNTISLFIQHCQSIQLDKQQRFAIANELLEYAQISKKSTCVCIGQGSYGRILDLDRWKKLSLQLTPDPEPDPTQALTDEQKLYFNMKKSIDFVFSL